MTIQNWNSELAELVARLCASVAADPQRSEADRLAAKMTGGVPVYSDMQGSLVLTEDGRILRWMADEEKAEAVNDDRWTRIALRRAGAAYAGLSQLVPRRPTDASDCVACRGTGTILESVDCAVCAGYGWC